MEYLFSFYNDGMKELTSCRRYKMKERTSESTKIMLLIMMSFISTLSMVPFNLNAYWDHAWNREIPFRERGIGVSSHSITIDSADRSHVVYSACSKSGECALRHAVQEGEAWTDELVDPVCGKSAARITAGVPGNLHVCYQGRDGLSGQGTLMYAVHDADQWSTHVVGKGGEGCSISLNPQGYPYISHIDENGGLQLARFDGTQWTSENVAQEANPIEPTSIDIAPSGEVHIAFVSNSDPPGIFWVRNGSGSWFSSLIDYGKQIRFVLDSKGNPRIVYKPDKKLSAIYGEFDGLQWRNSPIFEHIYTPHANQVSYYPALAIDTNDAVHISYVHLWHLSILDFSGWIGELGYVKYDGITWEESSSIQDIDDGFSFVSSIALDSYGFPRVSYNIANLNGPLRFAYFVTPELTGRWMGFTLKNKNDEHSLKGSLRIINSGDGLADAVRIKFFLSDDMNLSSDDIPIGQYRAVSDLKPGRQRNIKFSWSTAGNPSGKYILAVIDPEGLNLERNKTDNIVYQVIPYTR
jgi:hypothetical protein